MRMSAGVEWAVHCCVVLSQATEPVPVTRLAEFHGVSKTYLGKHLQQLSRAELVRSTEGRTGGYQLTRDPDAITVLEIVQAIDGPDPAFRCTEIRRRGPLAASPDQCVEPCGIAQVMATAELAWREALRRVTVADLAATFDASSGGTALVGLRGWLTGNSGLHP